MKETAALNAIVDKALAYRPARKNNKPTKNKTRDPKRPVPDSTRSK